MPSMRWVTQESEAPRPALSLFRGETARFSNFLSEPDSPTWYESPAMRALAPLREHFVRLQYQPRILSPPKRICAAVVKVSSVVFLLGTGYFRPGWAEEKVQPERLRRHAFNLLGVVKTPAHSEQLVRQLQQFGVVSTSRDRVVVEPSNISMFVPLLQIDGAAIGSDQQACVCAALVTQHQITMTRARLRVKIESLEQAAKQQHGRHWREALLTDGSQPSVGAYADYLNEMAYPRAPALDELKEYVVREELPATKTAQHGARPQRSSNLR